LPQCPPFGKLRATRQALAAWALPLALLLAVAGFAALQGWWWVVAFAAVDIAALVVALRLYSRHALDGEIVMLGDDGMLRVEQQRGSRVLSAAWPASLVRLDTADGELITLRAGRDCLRIGRHATPACRELASRELRQRLRLG